MKRKQGYFRVSNTILIVGALIWTLLILYFIFRSGSEITTYLIVIFGIFLCMTFGLVTFYLIKNQLPFGIYAALSIVSLLIVVQQMNFAFRLNAMFHAISTLGILFMLMIISLFKLWEMLSEIS